MKKLLSIVSCLALGLITAGCNTAPETPVIDVAVEGGEVVEVILPPEVTEAIKTATEAQEVEIIDLGATEEEVIAPEDMMIEEENVVIEEEVITPEDMIMDEEELIDPAI
jgi:hypothetical protein